MRRWVFFLASLLGMGGCEQVDLERMIEQSSYRPYEANPRFDDGMAMRRPPPGTIPRSRQLGPRALVEGMRDGRWVEEIPVAPDRGLIMRGQDRYRIFCAPCHGVEGDGESQVAENMDLRPPPSLVDPPVAEYVPGRIYRAIVDGYGLMPSYSRRLSVRDRWAVVAFVEVLELSRRAKLEALPPHVRQEAEAWLD